MKFEEDIATLERNFSKCIRSEELPSPDRRPPDAVRNAVIEKLIKVFSSLNPCFDMDLIFVGLNIFDLYASHEVINLGDVVSNLDDVSRACALLAIRQIDGLLYAELLLKSFFSTSVTNRSRQVGAVIGDRRVLCPSDFLSLWWFDMGPLQDEYTIYARRAIGFICSNFSYKRMYKFKPEVVACCALMDTFFFEIHGFDPWDHLKLFTGLSPADYEDCFKVFTELYHPPLNHDPVQFPRFGRVRGRGLGRGASQSCVIL